MSPFRFPWFVWLALKFILSTKRERWTSFISTIALLGVTISVAALTVVNAVMTGFKQVIYEKVLSLNPHLLVVGPVEERASFFQIIKKTIPQGEVVSLTEAVITQGLLLRGGQSSGVILKGVELEEISQEKAFRYFKYEKEFLSEVIPIVVGERLKERLGLSLGEELSLLTPQGFHTPFGFFPKVYTLKVIGFFASGVYDYDLNLLYLPLQVAKERFPTKEIMIEIKLKDPFRSSHWKNQLLRHLSFPRRVLDWQELNRNLFSALKLEKFGLFVVLSLMVGVSLFTVISAMVMLVSEKRLDIGILRALGARERDILRLFFFCGFFLSFLGMFLGLSLGSSLCFLLSKYPVVKLPEEVYPVEYLPVRLEGFDLLVIALTVLCLGVISAFYPAKRASTLNPAEILRMEG